jgi:hypothetical protein
MRAGLDRGGGVRGWAPPGDRSGRHGSCRACGDGGAGRKHSGDAPEAPALCAPGDGLVCVRRAEATPDRRSTIGRHGARFALFIAHQWRINLLLMWAECARARGAHCSLLSRVAR